MKIVEFANSVYPDEVAHYEPPHLDIHCLQIQLSSGSLLFSLQSLNSQYDIAWTKHFKFLQMVNVVAFSALYGLKTCLLCGIALPVIKQATWNDKLIQP